MPGSRGMQIGVALVLVAVVLVALASATGWPDWVTIVAFVVAAVVAQFAWPGRRTDD